MLEGIVQDQVTALLGEQAEWGRELAQDFDFAALEAKVGEALNRLGAEVLKGGLECAARGAGVHPGPEGLGGAVKGCGSRVTVW
nr:hypothetical protein [Gammaproteobacteria bacterium]